MTLQSLHTLTDTQSSDFAGRVTTAVRRQMQTSSRILVFFTVGHLLGIGGLTMGPQGEGAARAAGRDRLVRHGEDPRAQFWLERSSAALADLKSGMTDAPSDVTDAP